MDKRLERILPRVQKPARYTGGEYNQIIKDKSQVDLRLAFCFPDTYEIGMSNLGMSILYDTMNSLPFVWCERVYAPWGDMYEEMKKAGIPLYALESGDPVGDFDSLAFSIGYEMAYTTVLDMLDMAGIPLRTADRPNLLPLIWAGGTAAVNAEPMAPFLDLFVVGEGEEVDNELLTLLREAKLSGWSKHEFLVKAAQIQGVYVPSLYDVSYNAGRHRRRRDAEGRRPRPGHQAHHLGPGQGALPHKAHRAQHRGGPRPGEPGALPGLPERLPLLPGGACVPPPPGQEAGDPDPPGHRIPGEHRP